MRTLHAMKNRASVIAVGLMAVMPKARAPARRTIASARRSSGGHDCLQEQLDLLCWRMMTLHFALKRLNRDPALAIPGDSRNHSPDRLLLIERPHILPLHG
jgi:hypothetical protein